MITVEVRFFGDRQQFTRRLSPQVEAGLPRVSLPDSATVDDLLALLGVSTGEGRPLVSINRFYHRDNVRLTDGDRVLLLTTVVGG
jgi:molybdopterin converting factor small subunit